MTDTVQTPAQDPGPPSGRWRLFRISLLSILLLIAAVVVWLAYQRRHPVSVPVHADLGLPGTDETEPRMDEDLAQLKRWIAAGDVRSVDELLNRRQAEYRSGKLSDVGLRNVFDAFKQTDAGTGTFVDGWVVQLPRSYAGRLGRGIFYRSLGEERRGSDWIARTPHSKVEQMMDAFGIAFAELQTSLTLEEKPIVTYQYLISVGKHVKDDAYLRHQFGASVRLDPRNFIVRRIYLRMLRPRWHGSIPMMEGFVEDSRRAGLPPSQISELEALVELEYAGQAEQAGQWADSVARYALAAKVFPHTNVEVWNGYARAALKLPAPQGCARAMPILQNTLTLRDYGDQNSADRAWPHGYLGFCLLQQGNAAAGSVELRAAAELGDPWSQVQLGDLLWQGGKVPRDQAAATALWQKAAAAGDVRAADRLKGIHVPSS